MKPRSFIVLAVVTVVFVVAAIWSVGMQREITNIAADRENAFPGLIEKANDVASVAITSNKGTFTITGAGITVADFDYLSAPAGGNGPFKVAAHVQGIEGGLSGWLTGGGNNPVVPLPPAALAGGAMLAGLVVRRRIRGR